MPLIRFYLLAFLLAALPGFAQLGFCPGSQGEPIFAEHFGNGTTYGPALAPGITTYGFAAGAPQDGLYTLHHYSGQYSTWHYAPDHTPDQTDGPNGKMLLVNAHAVTSGDFYKKTVSGLCVNTTFQFSAWLMNVYNPGSNYCGAGEIPINVRFEIWNAAETVLLGSGNTGNIMGTPTPLWQQFALVFTTAGETSVVLKMKNNGLGGCGNDLAIDDISFAACGELTSVYSTEATGTTFTTCVPASIQLQAYTGVPYVYQWQVSSDAVTWTDIPLQNGATYQTPMLSAQTYYRVRAAQDLANLGNPFCSTTSNIFTVSVLAAPDTPVSNGDAVICSDAPVPSLSVSAVAGVGVNWYDAPVGGNLLQANSLSFTPPTAGTFYAEAVNAATNCVSATRTPVSLTIVPLPNASIAATALVCHGDTAVVGISGTPNAMVTYSIDGGPSQTIALDASGTAQLTTAALTAATVYTLISCTSPLLATCTRTLGTSVTIAVAAAPVAVLLGATSVCAGSGSTVGFAGTAHATVRYSVDSGAAQTITLNESGQASLTTGNINAPVLYALIDVTLGSCVQTLSQTLTIAPIAPATAAVSVNPAVICGSQTAQVMFTGTPNATVHYTMDGGPAQTITLDALGAAGFAVSGLTATRTYTLTGVSTAAPGACLQPLNVSATLTAGVSPMASFEDAALEVCYGSAATIMIQGTPQTIVTYTVGSGAAQTVTLDTVGRAAVTVSGVTSTAIWTLVSVSAAGSNPCTQMLGHTLTVSVVPELTASLAVAATICEGQTASVSISGTPNAMVTLNANGTTQNVALDAGGHATLSTGVLFANATYQLIGISLSDGRCSRILNSSVLVTVAPLPDVVFSGALRYCSGDPTAIVLSSGAPGTVFQWTAYAVGVLGAASGSGNWIAQPLEASGTTAGNVTYTVTPVRNGCVGTPVNIVVEVFPVPEPMMSDGVICTLGTGPASGETYLLDTQLDPATHAFQWFFDGIAIPDASGPRHAAAQTGIYTVLATNAAGCVSAPTHAVVGERSQGRHLTAITSGPFADDASITAMVTGGDGPFWYQLDQGAFQESNVFSNVSPGTHTVRAIDEFCTDLSASVKLLGYPKFFTPNGDGYHDRWNISGMDNARIRIFDRFGKLLKELSSAGAGWDGAFNGQSMPASDYWFTVEYTFDGKNEIFKSHFTLKR